MESCIDQTDHDVIVTGIPPAMNQLKIILFFNREANCKVKVSRISEETVGLVFNDNKGLQNFLDANIKEVLFGNVSHKLQYLKVPSNIKNPEKSYAEQNRIFSRIQCWSDLTELPAPGWTRCVLAQNIDQSLPLQVVKMHFESKRRSGGGPVKTIIRMPDGVLVVFIDPKDCKSCLNTCDQMIDQNKLQITGKIVPMYYGRKFIIEGVQEGTTEDHLKMFLERCTINEISPISCMKQSSPGVFLVEYDEEFDVSETNSFLKKVSQEPLEEHKLKASRLLQSDCIRIMGVPASISDDKIRMTIESKRRVDGGPVTKVTRLKNESALVYFENFFDAEQIARRFNALSSRDVKIDGQIVTVQLYYHELSKDHKEHAGNGPEPQPKYYDRMFVIEGVCESTLEDDLMMCLESCSENETTPISCIKQTSGVYVIGFGDEFGLAETENFLKKVSLKHLGGNKLRASRLLRSNCLRVCGVPRTTSDGQIMLSFESKMRFDGELVSKVDRLPDGSILVYFTDETNAERFYNTFKLSGNEMLEIDHSVVTIELYHNSLWRNLREKEQHSSKGDSQNTSLDQKELLKVIEFEPACSEKVFFFFKNNPTHCKSLSNAFRDIAKIELYVSSEEKHLSKCTLIQEVLLRDQGEYEKKLMDLFKDFSKAYCSKLKSFEYMKLQKVASLKLHPLLGNFPCDYINDDLIVRWKHNTAVVTGLKNVVENAIASIEKCMEYETAEIPVTENQYKIMTVCGIVEQLQQKFDKAVVTCNDEKHKITVDGTEDDKNAIFLHARTLRDAVEQRRVVGLNEDIGKYLGENAAVMQSNLQDHIIGKNIKAVPGFEKEELHFHAKNVAEHLKAVDAINSFIAVETVPVTGIRVEVVSSYEWQNFKKEMRSIGNCAIHIKNDKSIVIVGLQSDVRTVRAKIDMFFNENAVNRIVLSMPYGEARYILERCKLFDGNCQKRKALKSCGLTHEQGGGIFLEGRSKSVEKARVKIAHIQKSMVQKKHTRTDPGIKQYYLKASGEQILQTIGRANSCIILADSPQCSEWEGLNQGKTARPLNAKAMQKEGLVSAKLGNVKLSLWKVDILQHHCDVIINTSNADLQLQSSRGVSGAIKKYDVQNANQIQSEMDIITKQMKGNISHGDAFITGAGNLPNCKKIVHVVGPSTNPLPWLIGSQNGAKYLKAIAACVKKSLEKTEEAKLTSIAIPAISCGVFGGKPDTSIPVILNAVTEYFHQHQASCITQVDFVEISNAEVLQEFRKGLSTINQGLSTKPNLAPKPVPRTSVTNSSKASSVSLVRGDIVEQKVDVIVNIMAAGHVKDITQGSVIAKAIATAAGPDVVNECAASAGKYSAGSVFASDAGKLGCKKIYHGLIEGYGTNSANWIKSIVQSCLQMATQANYKTIAFPAIGTGKFNHPPDKVAQWMKEAIEKHTSNNLSASIILHPSNPPVSLAFYTEFYGPPNTLQSCVKFGSMTISVLQGDITQQGTDAIVNSADPSFDLTRAGMISSAILQKGGSNIQDELKNASGEIAVTSGGKLPCNHIIHLATSKNEKDLGKQLLAVLTKANELKLSSIAIPALATGNIQMTARAVGSKIRSAIEAFVQLHLNPPHLCNVNVVIFDVIIIQDFKDAILRDIASSKNMVQNPRTGLLTPGSTMPKTQVVQENLDLYFYAGNAKDIEKALGAIDIESVKVILKETIENEAIASITPREEAEIEEIRNKNRVKIEYKCEKNQKHILVAGLLTDVRKACDSIRAILTVIKEANNFVEYIAWESLGANKQWVGLPARVAHDMEKAYKIQKGGNLGLIQVDEYSIQYSKMIKQTYDLSTLGKSDALLRRRMKNDTLPPLWDSMDGAGLKQVTLKPDSAEYKDVLNKFQATGHCPTIIAIERIQSMALRKQYDAKKSEITEKLKGKDCKIERQLFHGTSNAAKIINNGFDRSFAGQHAAAFGLGVYFATDATYSHRFTSPGPNDNVRTMFLANVLTGMYTIGKPGMKTTPPRDGLDLYDSVVNNVDSPSIYVIFKDASAYPTYLIKYK